MSGPGLSEPFSEGHTSNHNQDPYMVEGISTEGLGIGIIEQLRYGALTL